MSSYNLDQMNSYIYIKFCWSYLNNLELKFMLLSLFVFFFSMSDQRIWLFPIYLFCCSSQRIMSITKLNPFHSRFLALVLIRPCLLIQKLYGKKKMFSYALVIIQNQVFGANYKLSSWLIRNRLTLLFWKK